MSLEDKTMTPYVMQQQYQQQQLQAQSKPSSLLGGVKTKPKLALGSMARTPSPHLNAASSSSAATSEGMSRSTSFEGALIAETSHVNVDGDDYKLCAETLQDLGRLGEGASGEVRKVLHKPSGLIMAKKVGYTLGCALHGVTDAVTNGPATDDTSISERRCTETDPA